MLTRLALQAAILDLPTGELAEEVVEMRVNVDAARGIGGLLGGEGGYDSSV